MVKLFKFVLLDPSNHVLNKLISFMIIKLTSSFDLFSKMYFSRFSDTDCVVLPDLDIPKSFEIYNKITDKEGCIIGKFYIHKNGFVDLKTGLAKYDELTFDYNGNLFHFFKFNQGVKLRINNKINVDIEDYKKLKYLFSKEISSLDMNMILKKDDIIIGDKIIVRTPEILKTIIKNIHKFDKVKKVYLFNFYPEVADFVLKLNKELDYVEIINELTIIINNKKFTLRDIQSLNKLNFDNLDLNI